MKYSKQRELILKTLETNVVHPTADYIYAIVKEDMPNISLATVYRNLNQLSAEGVIKKIEGLEPVAHFDHNTHNHHHFICSSCNKVYDVPYKLIPNLSDIILLETGLRLESCEISLKGLCQACQKNN